jgi:hypothetical protein
MIFKIFSQNFSAKKLAFFTQNKAKLCRIFIITLRKTPFFRRKLAKISENCDNNIDPRIVFFLRKSVKTFSRRFWYRQVATVIRHHSHNLLALSLEHLYLSPLALHFFLTYTSLALNYLGRPKDTGTDWNSSQDWGLSLISSFSNNA